MNHFLTFGSPGWEGALERIRCEAQASHLFDCIYTMTPRFLPPPNFADAPKQRGYGWWGWKPYLALAAMGLMKDGDILVYSDAGNTIGANWPAWELYFTLAHAKDALFFMTDYPESRHTKMDTVRALCEPGAEALSTLSTPQLWAGGWVVKKCDRVVSILERWRRVFDNLHLVDDSPSLEPNAKDFVEHRHDQSVLSILVKLAQLGEWHPHSDNLGGPSPIQCTRRR